MLGGPVLEHPDKCGTWHRCRTERSYDSILRELGRIRPYYKVLRWSHSPKNYLIKILIQLVSLQNSCKTKIAFCLQSVLCSQE